MTASLGYDPSHPLPDPVAMPDAATARKFALGTRSRHLRNVESDFFQVPQSSNQPKPPRQVSHAAVRILDPIDAFARQLEERLASLMETVNAYDDRISALEEQAAVEGYFLNSRSRETFLEFFISSPLTKLGHLFLLESGNLRAVWKGDDKSHVGLQFLDNGLIQYVLFRQRLADGPVSRAYGRDTPRGVLAQISALQLDQAVFR